MNEQELQVLANLIADKYGYAHPQVLIGPVRGRFLAECWPKQNLIKVTMHVILTYRKCAVKTILKHELAHMKVPHHGKAFGEELKKMGLKVIQRTRTSYYESDIYYDKEWRRK
jgi:predicted metal-dependent hydrolase